MLVVRPVVEGDLEEVYKLAQKTGGGLTTLPPNRGRLREKIRESVKNFEYCSNRPNGEIYFFVLEDTDQKRIVGTSAVYSKVGGFYPFWTYELKTVTKKSELLRVCKDVQYLQVKMEHNGPSEVGTLFLDPDYRHSSNGRLLSLCRFLFVAAHRTCFEDHILAELRGRIDSQGNSVFWDCLGAHFFNIPFEKADLMVNEDKTFIDELMPKHPIYIPLLPREAQVVIGMVHDDSRPAMRLLEKEGFTQIDEVDIFEAGPIVQANTDDIRTIRDSRSAALYAHPLDRPSESAEAQRLYLVASDKGIKEFKVMVSIVGLEGQEVSLPKEVSAALGLEAGDSLRYVELRPELKQ